MNDEQNPISGLEVMRQKAVQEVFIQLSALEAEKIVQEWMAMREEVEAMREQVDDAVAQLKELQEKGYRPWDPSKHQEAMDSLKKAEKTLSGVGGTDTIAPTTGEPPSIEETTRPPTGSSGS